MGWKKVAAAGCLAPVLGGCNLYYYAAHNLINEAHVVHTQLEISHELRKDAKVLWQEVRAQYPRRMFTAEFRDGFIDGYADYLNRGGHAQAPTVPPPKFTRDRKYFTPEGHCLLKDYYLGFQYGMDVAVASGQRQFLTVPVVLPVRPEGPPAFTFQPKDGIPPTGTSDVVPPPGGITPPVVPPGGTPPATVPPNAPGVGPGTPAVPLPAPRPAGPPMSSRPNSKPAPGVKPSAGTTPPPAAAATADPGAKFNPMPRPVAPVGPNDTLPALNPPLPVAEVPTGITIPIALPEPPPEVPTLPAHVPTPPVTDDLPVIPPNHTSPPPVPANHPPARQ